VNIYNLTRLFLLTTFLLLPSSVFAANEVEKLEQEALSYLLEHYNETKPDVRTEIKLNPISRKIKLKTCLAPYLFQTPRGNGSRITLRARCTSPLWQLYIIAELKQFGTAVIARSSLPRNTYLKNSDLIRKEVNLTSLRSAYFSHPSEIIGWTNKRSIAAGSIITASMLAPPLAVIKGNALIIEAKHNGITIRASGTSMQDGTIGQQIKVRNDSSGNIIRATVVERGLVRTP